MAFLQIQKKNIVKPAAQAMPEVESGQIRLTLEAAKQIQSLQTALFRVGLQGGGCSGLKPFFALENKAKDNDIVWSEQGVNLCIDPKSLSLLGGSWLDYDQGFKIHSTRLRKSCSCGESFALS